MSLKRYYYSASIDVFCVANIDEILGVLTKSHQYALEQTQRDAWLEQITILQSALQGFQGTVYFEYSIPRMGCKRQRKSVARASLIVQR